MYVADWLYALLPMPFSLLVQANTLAENSEEGSGYGLLSRLLSPFFDDISETSPGTGLLLWSLFLVVPVLLAAGFTLVRRTRPQWLFGAAFVHLALFGNFVLAGIALYSYAAHFTDRRLLSGWGVMMALAMVVAYPGSVFALVFLSVFFLVMPLIFGLWVGTRRQLVYRLKERAERLAREQHLMAEKATAAERTRIAREMHDVVAHRVSLMVLHAGGLEVSSTDLRATETAGLIRTTGREALAELRSILGVLRDETTGPAPVAPQPVLADLPRLLEEWRGVGMEVTCEEFGSRWTLPTSAQRTAFRVVQEGVTNAAKHAPGATVTVRLHHGGERLEIEVANGPTPAPFDSPPHSGFGLAGLRERLTLIRGELTLGACPDGGWRLRAIVPNEEQEPTTEEDTEDEEIPR